MFEKKIVIEIVTENQFKKIIENHIENMKMETPGI